MARLLLGVPLCLYGCGPGAAVNDDGAGGTGGAPGPVGSACAADTDCVDGLTCVVQLPDGFCTQECETVCPGETLCVRVDVAATSYRICLPQCDADHPCRDQYACEPIGQRQICWPP